MRGERGQASIEWIGAVLMLALALAGLTRLAERVDAAGLGAAVVRTTICAAGGGCDEVHTSLRGTSVRGTPRSRTFVAPPLLPLTGDPRPDRRRAKPDGSRRRARLRRARRPAGAFWRRAWLICFGYERVRYGLLHPETRPRQTVPLSGALQMINDCASPIDFARDWELLRPR